MHRTPGRKSLQRPIPTPSTTISGTPQGVVLGFPLTNKKDACLSPTPARAATCLCRGDLSPMTLRCLESSGNGAEGAQSQWGTAGSAEEPSPEAARLAKALRVGLRCSVRSSLVVTCGLLVAVASLVFAAWVLQHHQPILTAEPIPV